MLATSHVLAKDPGWNLKRITGKTTFAGTPEWRLTLQRIVDMKNAGCFPPGAEANDNIPATPGFVSGQVVGWTLPSSIVGLLKSFNKAAKYNFFAMPGDDRGGHPRQRVADRRLRRVVEVVAEGGGVQADRLHGDPCRHGPLRRSHGRRLAVPGRHRQAHPLRAPWPQRRSSR